MRPRRVNAAGSVTSSSPTLGVRLDRVSERYSCARGVVSAAHPSEVMTHVPGSTGLCGRLTDAAQHAYRSNDLGIPMTAADTPVLDTLADLTAISVERCALPARELMLARMAALIAVDAPPASYLANAGAAADSGITADDLQAVMIGIAPVVGTPRVVAAAGNISRALGFAIMVAEAELAEEVDAG